MGYPFLPNKRDVLSLEPKGIKENIFEAGDAMNDAGPGFSSKAREKGVS